MSVENQHGVAAAVNTGSTEWDWPQIDDYVNAHVSTVVFPLVSPTGEVIGDEVIDEPAVPGPVPEAGRESHLHFRVGAGSGRVKTPRAS